MDLRDASASKKSEFVVSSCRCFLGSVKASCASRESKEQDADGQLLTEGSLLNFTFQLLACFFCETDGGLAA